MGVQGNISYFDGVVSGTVKNCFEEPLENAALLINGKAVLLGKIRAWADGFSGWKGRAAIIRSAIRMRQHRW